MGAAVSTSTSSVVQTAVNRTYQRAQNSCTATCNQIQQGNVVVLDNTTAGDITFTQRCTADASCYMSNAVEAVVSTFQAAVAEAEAAPSLFPGFQINIAEATTESDITNEMTQIMENLCEGSVNQNNSENVVYATDSTVGNIGFLQEGNAFARCVMENSGRLDLQMRQDGQATAATGAAATGIGGIIALVIVVVIIIIIVRSVKKKGDEGKGEDMTAQNSAEGRRMKTSTGKNGKSSSINSEGISRQIQGFAKSFAKSGGKK
jgi:hypothetical protein